MVAGVIATWTISGLIAFLPLSPSLQNIYVESAFFPDNPFYQNARVFFDAFRSYTERYFTFDTNSVVLTSAESQQINQATTWNEYEGILQNYNLSGGLQTALFFGQVFHSFHYIR